MQLWRIGAICGFIVSLAALPALAQQNIGSTSVVRNQVSRELAGAAGALSVGDNVFVNEAVRTGEDSAARLVFLDQTSLAIGPVARVVLDRFVFDPQPSAQAASVSLTKGVFRFTTGVLDKKAYSITTPVASIGVRGTVLDIDADGKQTRVTLVEGRALVCPRSKGTAFEQLARDCARGVQTSGRIGGQTRKCDCVALENPGQTVTVTATKGAPRAALASTPVNFASLCGADPGLCSGAADYAYAGGGAALCGR